VPNVGRAQNENVSCRIAKPQVSEIEKL